METLQTLDADLKTNSDLDCYSLSMLESGTGCMVSLSHTIRKLQEQGYVENLVPAFDHFACRSGQIKITPDILVVDKMVRFENASDPDDQAILYAISSAAMGVKGLYVDSYGVYHDELSPQILMSLRNRST